MEDSYPEVTAIWVNGLDRKVAQSTEEKYAISL